jgi:peptidoglycan/LPS O-acetylase OafA/YrhL
MPERINGGQALVVLGAAALIVSLFLHWYEPGRSAWTVFEVWDLALAAIGIAALAAVVPLRRDREADGHLVAQGWLPVLGGAALVIVVVALVNHPPAARGVGPELGAWIALAASIVLLAGAVLSRARISLLITLRSTDQPRRTDRPRATPAPPEPPEQGVDPDTATQTLPRQS